MTEIVNQPMLQSTSMHQPFNADARMAQEKLEAFNNKKNRTQEHYNKKVILDKLMLEAYYARLDALSIYTRNARLLSAQVEQGKYLDIEIK
tara:strand:- start:1982 stop:2254 length:273 start_codon:yes stop_codon:yes gene_type:complete